MLFRPAYEALGEELAELTPKQRAEVYQTALLDGLKQQIQDPVLEEILADNYYKANKQTIKKVMETPEYKQACEKKVREVVADSTEALYTRSIIDMVIDKVKGIEQPEVDLDEMLARLQNAEPDDEEYIEDTVPPADDDF